MSRIGRAPIPLPPGVEVSVAGRRVTVKGPQGTLERELPRQVTLRQEDGTVLVDRTGEEREDRALHGLARALVANMVVGVSSGFSKELEIVGVGYRVTSSGPEHLELTLGYSHTVHVDAPPGISFEVPVPTRVLVKGIDKELVGQVAADIRQLRKPEPYKGKGVRYAGEQVKRKAGKAGK